MNWLKRILDLGCVALASSVVLDPLLWLLYGYLVPSWTIGALSLGLILLLQVLKKLI